MLPWGLPSDCTELRPGSDATVLGQLLAAARTPNAAAKAQLGRTRKLNKAWGNGQLECNGWATPNCAHAAGNIWTARLPYAQNGPQT